MDLFATDRDRLAFLLETDAALDLDFEALEARAGELVTEELPPDKRPKYITNYIGSKQKLVDWIWKHTPEDVGSVIDAFSGSAVVAYMYKTKGLRVLANDRLRYCYHAARAIIENRNVRLTDDDLEILLADNPKAGTFVRDNFKGIFFAKGVHGLIDTIRANIDKLKGYKKDIALFALGKTCMSGKGGFGHFSSSTRYGKREDTPEEFKERFRKNVARINALVFDNGKECKAYRKDVNSLLPEVRVDLAYFDPPYATEFSTTNYEKAYHFVEGLMTYWDGLTLVGGSKTKHYETDHRTVTRANAKEFFETFLGNARHIPHWLISYRDHAHPNEREMRGIITAHGYEPAMRSRDHHYAITSRHGDASHAKERLFICKHGKGQSAKADASSSEAMRSQAVWEETENEIRYRVRDPKQFEPDSFRRKTLEGIDGVSIIIGRLKKEFVQEGDNPRSMVLQAYRFTRKTERNPDGWTIEKAKEWIKEHEASTATEAALRVDENLRALADAPLGDSLDLLSCQAGKADTVRVTGFMGSKYLMLGWIESQVPKGAESFLDAFSGGANVAYHFKRKGMKVIANDLLRFPYHLARAVIENSSEKLTDEDVEKLLAPNPDAGTFIVDQFYGYYYTKPVLRWLDQVWANIQKLHGYKKDLALAALGSTVKAKSAFGQFSRSKMHRKAGLESEASLEQSQLSNPPLSKFVESFKRSVRQLNNLVFDNGKECKAFNLDATEAVRRYGADVLYLDPPYVTEFGSNDYEDSLHFVEGLMTRWADKKIHSNPRRNFPSRTRYTKESIRTLMETLAADAAGRVTASFVIPSNVRNGNRIVEVTDGTYSAQTNLQVNDPLVITRIQRIVVNRTIVRRQTIVQRIPPRIIRVPVVRTVWRWRWRWRRRDPLAQTFSFIQNRVISAVGVHFTQKDASIPVTVQIRGVTTGLPNEVVLAEKVVSPDEINLGGETKITFDDPFYAEANTSYAVVLLTNSTNYRVRIATLGQMGQNGVITRQTYAEGVLLESSNAETWTPLSGSDLTMKIYGYDFQPSGEVRFQPVTGVQFSELNIDEYSAIPEGTGIVWEYSTDGGSTWDAIVPAEEENLPNIANEVLVRALFDSSAANDSPALNYKDVNLIGYLNNVTGAYITRENELTQGVESTKVYTQMNIPSGTSLNWFASNDGGATWEPMSIESTREIDQEWTEYTLTRTFSDPTGNKVRYKAEMTGNNLVYPRIHTLGATLS